jgi:voltage-gated potassium channel Kch
MTDAPLTASSRGERSLTALLILLILDLFVAYPSSAAGFVLDTVSRGLLTLLLVAGSLAAVRRRRFRAPVIALFAVTIVAGWAALGVAGPALDAFRLLSMLASLGVISATLLAQVSQAGPVTAHRIRGAIAVYLLIAATFGYAYAALETLRPGAFTLPAWWTGDAPRQAEAFYYFSIVTLTTLGYGDVLPVHPVARSLVTVEALIGQLYPAILIARLVSLQIETTRAKRETGGDGPSKS